MEVSYTLTRDEVKRAVSAMQKTAGHPIAKFVGVLFGMVLFVAFFSYLSTPRQAPIVARPVQPGAARTQLLLTLLPLLVFTAFVFTILRNANDPAKQNPDLLLSQSASVLPEGFFMRSHKEDSLRRWNGLHAIEENDEFLLVFIAKQAALIIPKRAFPSPQAAQMFVARARELFEHARGLQPPIPHPRDSV